MNGNSNLKKQPLKFVISTNKNGLYSMVEKPHTEMSSSIKQTGLLWNNYLVKQLTDLILI